MLDNSFFEFLVELARALLIDELSEHVRRGLAKFTKLSIFRESNHYRRAIQRVHRRNRKRLLHRLLTEPDEEP